MNRTDKISEKITQIEHLLLIFSQITGKIMSAVMIPVMGVLVFVLISFVNFLLAVFTSGPLGALAEKENIGWLKKYYKLSLDYPLALLDWLFRHLTPYWIFDYFSYSPGGLVMTLAIIGYWLLLFVLVISLIVLISYLVNNLGWFYLKTKYKYATVYAKNPREGKMELNLLRAIGETHKEGILFLRSFSDKIFKYETKVTTTTVTKKEFYGSPLARAAGNIGGIPSESTETEIDISKFNVFYQVMQQFAPYGAPLIISPEKEDLPEHGNSYDPFQINSSDDDWFDIFKNCAEKCRMIVIILFSSTGLIDEIKHLITSGLITKTIIYLPSEAWIGVSEEEEKIPVVWEKLRTQFAEEHQFYLPKYSPKGLLYIPDEQLRVKFSTTLEEIKFDDALSQLISHLPRQKHPSLCDIVFSLQNFSAIKNYPYLEKNLTDFPLL